MNILLNIFLFVLIVVIALILCVLFFPVSYRAKGDIEKLDFAVKVQWLFHIVMFRASYKDEHPDYALYLFGIRTKLLDEDASNKRKIRRQKRKMRKAAKKRNVRKKKYQKKHDKYKEQYLKENPTKDDVRMNSQIEHAVKQSVDSLSKEEFSNEANHSYDSEKEKKSASKVMEVLKKVVHIIKTIAEHRPIQLLWPDIKKLLYRARPRKINADITFGFEDPAMTGKVIGAISNIYYLYQFDKLYINGDFEAEEAYVEGSFTVKGHLQAIFGILFAIRIFRKKQFRNFMKALKL